VNSLAIDDECNAARRKKTRFHGTLWIVIGIKPQCSCDARISARRMAQLAVRQGGVNEGLHRWSSTSPVRRRQGSPNLSNAVRTA
jgi:hypothetical protein